MTTTEESSYIKMDFSLETPEERTKKVKEIIANTPPEKLTPKYLEKLADYIIFAAEKQEKKKRYLTDNHMVTVHDRETSFEGLVSQLENGEDGIYNMIANDKNIIFKHKIPITEQDIAEVPGLKQLTESIEQAKLQLQDASGRRRYLIKKQIIEMSKDQYVLIAAHRKPMHCANTIKSMPKLDLDEKITITADGDVKSTGIINFFNEKHVCTILCNYSTLVQDSWEKMNSDVKWMMLDFDRLATAALAKHPSLEAIALYKIDGKSNAEIQKLVYEQYGIDHSVEYISSLWRNKIPRLIAEEAKKEYLIWHYTFVEKGKWKKCNRCGQIKLAHNMFFSKNKTSSDTYYSICKECRNKKGDK